MLNRMLTGWISAALLVLSFVLLTGMKSCSPSPDEPAQCAVAADCQGLVQPGCEGQWSCADGMCLCTWTDVGEGCDSDSDCPASQYCDPQLQQCTDKTPGGCETDAQCGPGQQCVMPPCYCDPGMDECPPCDGVCVDVPKYECTADSDCGDGQYCDFIDCDDEGCGGVCKPHWTGPECTTDADCGPGYECNQCATSSCPLCTDCVAACLPKVNPEVCETDADCGPGYECNQCATSSCPLCTDCVAACLPKVMPEVCETDADCGPGYECQLHPTWFYQCGDEDDCAPPQPVGQCVEVIVPPYFCYSDADCSDGQVCQLEDIWSCGCADDDPACDCAPPAGFCVDAPNTCTTDAECADDQYCELPACPMCDCPDDADECYCPPCTGECKANQMPLHCADDSDCDDDEYCAVVTVSYDGWPMGECKPKVNVEGCQTDAQCGAGQQCQQVCAPCWCEDGVDCECPCFGECVDVTTYCWSDADCATGQVCETNDIPLPVPFYECGCAYDEECDCDATMPPPEGVCVDAPTPEPTECFATGCSGEICASEDIASFCIWEPSYICLQYTTCGNHGPDGACGFEQNDAYLECLAQFQ